MPATAPLGGSVTRWVARLDFTRLYREVSSALEVASVVATDGLTRAVEETPTGASLSLVISKAAAFPGLLLFHLVQAATMSSGLFWAVVSWMVSTEVAGFEESTANPISGGGGLA